MWVQLHVSQVYLSLFPVFFFSLLCYQFFGELKMYKSIPILLQKWRRWLAARDCGWLEDCWR